MRTSTKAACLRGGGKGAYPSVRRSRQSSHEGTKMNLPKIRASFAAIAAAIAYLVTPSASAAILATNNFETACDGFTADIGTVEEAAGRTNYGTYPSGDAPYPFSGTESTGFGSKYLAVDTGDATIYREFASQTSSTYLDTFMQFEPTSGEISYTNVAKIVVYLDAATSNLCVISGTSAGDRTPVTNRLTSTVVEPGTWGRLTVNALKATSDSVFSFNVCLNGTKLTNGTTNTFYSLTDSNAVSRVGFKGTGALDDLVARTTDPFFSGTPVATIGGDSGERYATLAAAIADAKTGTTVVMQDDSSENVTLAFVGIRLDTNNHTYSGTISGASGVGISEENGIYTSIANTASTWTGSGGDGLWENAQNWSTKSVPTSATTVTFTNDTTVGIPYSGTSAYGLVVSEDVRVSIRNSNLSSYYWSTLTVGEGHVTGGGTIKLCGAGFSTSVSDLTINVNMEIGNANGYDSFLNQTGSGSYIVNGTLSCGEQGAYMTIPSAVTFNNAVTVSSGVNVKISNASVVLGDGASLDGTGEITFNTVEPSDSMKTALQNADKWTGVCELRSVGSDSTSIDAANYGNINSTVRFNGMTGYLRFSSGSVTDVGNVKRIDLTGDGLNLVNGFSSGTYGYRIKAELSGNGPFKAGTRHSGGAKGAGKYIITGATTNFTGAVNYGDTTSYRAVVVFATDAEYSAGTIPSPTDHGQIIVTAGRTGAMAVTAGAQWNGHGGFIINGTLNVASGGSLSTDSNGQKVQGSGTINYEALPTAGQPSTTTIPYFSDEWTGTVILPAANITQKTGIPLVGLSSANGRIVVKGFTRSANDLSIHLNTGTAQIKGTLQLDGDLYITDANSNATYTWNKVTGSGNMTVTQSTGSATGVTHAITTLDDYTGTLETKTFYLTIGTVNVPTLDLTVGDPIVKLADGCNLKTDPENIAVKVGDVATSHKLFKASDGNLYVKVASVTVNDVTTYYPTLQAAADAAMAAGGETIQFTRIDSEAETSLPGWTYENGVFTRTGLAYNATTEIEYATLAAAVAEASAGDTIKLLYNNSETAVDTTGKDFIFDENGYAFSGSWTGSGRIVLLEVPSTTWSNELFVVDGWTGTVKLNWEDFAHRNGSPDTGNITTTVNKYGIATSTVEIGENCLTTGNCYFSPGPTPKLKVTGCITVNDGSSSSQQAIPNISGNGVLVFGTNGNPVNYSITTLENWNGALTNLASNINIGTISSGSGVIYLKNPLKSGTDPTANADWQGRVVLDYANIVTADTDVGAKINAYGVSGSTVEIGVNGTARGYASADVSPNLEINGSLEMKNGSRNNERTISYVSGRGQLTFTHVYNNGGETTNYKITTLDNWTGIISNNSTSVKITTIESGSGAIWLDEYLEEVPTTIKDAWSGTVVINKSTSSGTAIKIGGYGNSNSKIVINQNSTGHLSNAAGNGNANFGGTLEISEGVALMVDNAWSNSGVTIGSLTGKGNLTVANTTHRWTGHVGYNIGTIDANSYSGTLTVGNEFKIGIAKITRNSEPALGTPYIKAAKAHADLASSSDGYFDVGSTTVEIAGEATSTKVVYGTIGEQSGLYKAVAQYGSNYYATFQDALNARKSAGVPGDIIALDASAPLPAGYSITDGKLVRTLKPMVILF